jgi:hypothetical protein
LELAALQPHAHGHRDLRLGKAGARRVGHRDQQTVSADGEIAGGGEPEGILRKRTCGGSASGGGGVATTGSENEQDDQRENGATHGV